MSHWLADPKSASFQKCLKYYKEYAFSWLAQIWKTASLICRCLVGHFAASTPQPKTILHVQCSTRAAASCAKSRWQTFPSHLAWSRVLLGTAKQQQLWRQKANKVCWTFCTRHPHSMWSSRAEDGPLCYTGKGRNQGTIVHIITKVRSCPLHAVQVLWRALTASHPRISQISSFLPLSDIIQHKDLGMNEHKQSSQCLTETCPLDK